MSVMTTESMFGFRRKENSIDKERRSSCKFTAGLSVSVTGGMFGLQGTDESKSRIRFSI